MKTVIGTKAELCEKIAAEFAAAVDKRRTAVIP